MLPPHGAVGLIVYKGNPKLAKKQNYAGQIEMVETAHLFAWGKSFPKLQSNMSISQIQIKIGAIFLLL